MEAAKNNGQVQGTRKLGDVFNYEIPCGEYLLDFDSFPRGTFVTDHLFQENFGVKIECNSKRNDFGCRLFDTAVPLGEWTTTTDEEGSTSTAPSCDCIMPSCSRKQKKHCGDLDLGSPNKKCTGGGPGHGNGGRPGEEYANCAFLGNVLILDENGPGKPPDDNDRGGTMHFHFDSPVDTTEICFLDVDRKKRTSLKVYFADGTDTTEEVPKYGNNGFGCVELPYLSVSKIRVRMKGSGAVTHLSYRSTCDPIDESSASPSISSSTSPSTSPSAGPSKSPTVPPSTKPPTTSPSVAPSYTPTDVSVIVCARVERIGFAFLILFLSMAFVASRGLPLKRLIFFQTPKVFELSVTPEEVIQGQDVILTFLVTPEAPPATVNAVDLFFVESGSLIGGAVDDGSTSAGDVTAGDGVYTNAFSFNFDQVGSVEFRAVVLSNDGSFQEEYTDTISIVDGSTVSNSTLSTTLHSRFYELSLDDRTDKEALQSLYEELMADPPSNVNIQDIVLDVGDFPFLSWTTLEGFTEVIIPDFPSPRSADDWDPIIFGDLAYNISSSLSDTDNDNRRMRSLQESVPSFVECVRGKQVSFFGMQGSNFLTNVAQAAGIPDYQIESHTSACSFFGLLCGSDPLGILKNLHRYEAVSLVSLSRVVTYKSSFGAVTRQTIAMVTDVPVDEANNYVSDIASKRVIAVNGYLAVTPAFFDKYTDSFDGGAVYFGGSKTTSPNGFASVFASKSVGAFFGHTSVWTAVDVWVSLLNGGTAGDTPCVASGSCHLATDPTYSFLNLCESLSIPNLIITYTWPLTQADLDTGTEFLNSQAGYACFENQYMQFSGDDTSNGGSETVIINLQAALDDGTWLAEDGVAVDLRAGWFSPAEGSGPAAVSVSLADGTNDSGIKTINPGSQSDCAQTCVGSAAVTVVPRRRVETSIGGTNCGTMTPPSPTLPPPRTGPTDCQQTYYDLVSFSDFGLGETAMGAYFGLNHPTLVLFIYVILRDTNDDARATARTEYPLAVCRNDECDAFRHAYFNYRITVQFDALLFGTVTSAQASAWAKLWGDAHERSVPNDFPERMMDLTNNDVGRRLAVENPKPTRADAIAIIKMAIADGLLALAPITACP